MNNDIPSEVVSYLLGHKTLNSMLIYTNNQTMKLSRELDLCFKDHEDSI